MLNGVIQPFQQPWATLAQRWISIGAVSDDRGVGLKHMTDDDRARELWELGTQRLGAGQVQEAVELFERSIAVKPTAEGYTFRGWALSHLGRLEEAIEDCKRAIQLDAEFGNPYNDIGVYLMQEGRLDEAIAWLEQAKLAKRYEPRHYPYANLGRIYERKGRWREALAEYREALRLEPRYELAMKAAARLRARMN